MFGAESAFYHKAAGEVPVQESDVLLALRLKRIDEHSERFPQAREFLTHSGATVSW